MDARCDAMQGDLAAYALGALERREMESVRVHLERCPRCAAIEREFETVASALLGAAPRVAPPPALKSRLLDSASRVPDVSGDQHERPERWMRVVVAAAVALLAITATLGVLLQRERGQHEETDATARTLAAYVSAGGSAMPLKAETGVEDLWPTGTASLYLAEGKPPLLVMSECPPTSEYYHYRVWLAADGQRRAMGEVVVDANGVGTLVLPDSSLLSLYDSIGVTLLQDGERTDLLTANLSAPPTARTG